MCLPRSRSFLIPCALSQKLLWRCQKRLTQPIFFIREFYKAVSSLGCRFDSQNASVFLLQILKLHNDLHPIMRSPQSRHRVAASYQNRPLPPLSLTPSGGFEFIRTNARRRRPRTPITHLLPSIARSTRHQHTNTPTTPTKQRWFASPPSVQPPRFF